MTIILVIHLREYQCIQLNHHNEVAKTIEEWEEKGWKLHTYQVAGQVTAFAHYLLFVKEKN